MKSLIKYVHKQVTLVRGIYISWNLSRHCSYTNGGQQTYNVNQIDALNGWHLAKQNYITVSN